MKDRGYEEISVTEETVKDPQAMAAVLKEHLTAEELRALARLLLED
jgi:hypothetical protein